MTVDLVEKLTANSKMARIISKEEREDYLYAFNEFDVDGSGSICWGVFAGFVHPKNRFSGGHFVEFNSTNLEHEIMRNFCLTDPQ